MSKGSPNCDWQGRWAAGYDTPNMSRRIVPSRSHRVMEYDAHCHSPAARYHADAMFYRGSGKAAE